MNRTNIKLLIIKLKKESKKQKKKKQKTKKNNKIHRTNLVLTVKVVD